MATTEYGDISQRTAAWAAAEMLAHAEPIIVLSKFGQTKPVPKNTADNVLFRRPIPFDTTIANNTLTEGVTPVAKQMKYENVPAALLQYGSHTEITDKVADMSEDPVLADATELCGEQSGEVIELVTYGKVIAGSNVIFSNEDVNPARSEVVSVLSLNNLRRAVRSLKSQRGKAITKMMSSSPSYQTHAVEGGFIAFAHTDCEADIRNIAGFIPVAKYGSRKPLCPEEVGTIENTRFILSPLFTAWPDAGGLAATNNTYSTTGTQADVYPVVIIAKDAYGCVPLKGSGAITPMVLNPNTPRGGDPLGQRGTVGWKSFYTAVILNEAWMIRIECAVSDLV